MTHTSCCGYDLFTLTHPYDRERSAASLLSLMSIFLLPIDGKMFSLWRCHLCVFERIVRLSLAVDPCDFFVCVFSLFVVTVLFFVFVGPRGVLRTAVPCFATLSYFRTQSCLTPSASYSLHGYLSQSPFQHLTLAYTYKKKIIKEHGRPSFAAWKNVQDIKTHWKTFKIIELESFYISPFMKIQQAV